MRIWMAAASAVAVVMTMGAAPAPSAQEQAITFLAKLDLVPAGPAAVEARCTASLDLLGRLRDGLEKRRGAATVAADYADYDAISNLLAGAGGEMSVISQSNTAKPVRDAGQACLERISAFASDLALSRPTYDRLAAIPLAGADETTRFLISRTLDDFRRAGVDRDEATRTRLAALDKEISTIGIGFDRNISEDKTKVVLDGPDALTGMPADYLEAHKPGPDGKITLTTSYPDVFPIFEFADREATRRTVYDAFNNRAYPANDAVLKQLIAKRQEQARLLNYPSYAALVTSDKMTGSPERVQRFLKEADAAADAAAKADWAKLLARYRQIDPKATALNSWSTGYLGRLVRKEQYDVDSGLVRQYFTLAKAQAGIFGLMKTLFDADIRPWKTPVWAEGVTAWELYDGDRLVGRFYLDLSPREGKYSHAAHFSLRTGLDGRQVPTSVLICNFPATGPMSHADVVVFLHEFGHLIHALYAGRQGYTNAAMGALQWDFIEAPSQLLEEWAWDYETLKTFASNDKGEPIPEALVAKMQAARKFGQGPSTKRQLGFSAVSLAFYSQPGPFDLDAVARAENGRYWPFPDPEGTHMYASFNHLNGYSAIYYTYTWSKAISLDLLTRFRSAGLQDRATAMAYRKAVLEAGGSRPAGTLVREFLGREWNTDAFRKELAPDPALAR